MNTPLALVMPSIGVVKVLPVPVAVSTTASPAIGLPLASSAVTVSVVVELPLAVTVVGTATSVELLADTAPGSTMPVTALIAVALLSKQACSLGVLGKGTDRLAVGLGMMPRGEVGLIFAGIGSGLMIGGERVVDPTVFSAVVATVAATTLLTPPLLAWRLRRLPAPADEGRPQDDRTPRDG